MNVLNRKKNHRQNQRTHEFEGSESYRQFKALLIRKKRLEEEHRETALKLSDLMIEIKSISESDIVQIFALKERIRKASELYARQKTELEKLSNLVK